MSEHTKTPWMVDAMGNIWASDTKIADMSEQPVQSNHHYREKSDEEHEANARHIVKAVNYHDRLVEALSEMLELFGNCAAQDMSYTAAIDQTRTILQELEGEL